MLPKFDQLTHCYTLFTVSDVGETGKNEGGEEEVVSSVDRTWSKKMAEG